MKSRMERLSRVRRPRPVDPCSVELTHTAGVLGARRWGCRADAVPLGPGRFGLCFGLGGASFRLGARVQEALGRGFGALLPSDVRARGGTECLTVEGGCGGHVISNQAAGSLPLAQSQSRGSARGG